ncbi:hypothetical protein BBP40_005069 [Aspergillus hancockii]|nr:hypothetical protein BBP40_005069 [Aspergillus hancockii]
MTQKKKEHFEFLDIEPLNGAEIGKLLGHVTSNPYSPTDCCISTDQHPYLADLRDETRDNLRKAIKSRNCHEALLWEVCQNEFWDHLKEPLKDCLCSEGRTSHKRFARKCFEAAITAVVLEQLHTFLLSFQKDIEKVQEEGAPINGRSRNPRKESADTIHTTKQALERRLMELDRAILKKSLDNQAQRDHQKQSQEESEQTIRTPNKIISAVVHNLEPLSLDKGEFSQNDEQQLLHVAKELHSVLEKHLHSEIVSSRLNYIKQNENPAIIPLQKCLADCLSTAQATGELNEKQFVGRVKEKMKTIKEQFLQPKAKSLSDATKSLCDNIRDELQKSLRRNREATKDIDRIVDDSFGEQQKQLVQKYQRKATVAAAVAKPRGFLTPVEVEYLNGNHSRKHVIIRKVEQYQEIHNALHRNHEYKANLRRLLRDVGAAYLVTATYSFLEVGNDSPPVHDSCGLKICGMPETGTPTFFTSQYHHGLDQFDMGRFVVSDEVLFRLVVHKITPSIWRGSYYSIRRLFYRLLRGGPQVAESGYKSHSMVPLMRAL